MNSFNISFKKIRNALVEVEISISYAYQEIIEDFEKELWIPHSETYARAGTAHNNRFQLLDPESEKLQSLSKYLDSAEVKKSVIDNLYLHSEGIGNMWGGWSPEKMNDCTLWGGSFIKDLPGFGMPAHLDTRLTVAGMMIYFMESSDQQRATNFYTSENLDNTYIADTSFCKGVVFLNTHHQWHSIVNSSTLPRYLSIHALVLDIKNHNYFD
jgi:hypothetical protein